MLRTLTLAAIAPGLLAGMLTTANAQTPPVAPMPPPAAMPAHPPAPHPMPPSGPHRAWRLRHLMRTWALLDPATDRKLTPPEVQTVAQAFLLWHGNRTWKVGDVAEQADGWIAFAFTAPDGTVIARFEMNPHTGRLRRLG
ncbi:MAG: hypothetical protein ACREF1_15815 [Acetobacteraceae bacterium]